MKIPLFVTATDLNNGVAEYFSSGELLRPVIASASIPVLFKPVIINKIHYVDGGVLDNMPIKPIEGQCDFIIGSFVNPTGYEKTVTSLIQIAERTFMLNMSKDLDHKAKKFDVFIAPPELKNYKILDPEKAIEVFEIGYKATKSKLEDPEVKKLYPPIIATFSLPLGGQRIREYSFLISASQSESSGVSRIRGISSNRLSFTTNENVSSPRNPFPMFSCLSTLVPNSFFESLRCIPLRYLKPMILLNFSNVSMNPASVFTSYPEVNA